MQNAMALVLELIAAVVISIWQKTIKRAIDYLTMAEDFKAVREFIG